MMPSNEIAPGRQNLESFDEFCYWKLFNSVILVTWWVDIHLTPYDEWTASTVYVHIFSRSRIKYQEQQYLSSTIDERFRSILILIPKNEAP